MARSLDHRAHMADESHGRLSVGTHGTSVDQLWRSDRRPRPAAAWIGGGGYAVRAGRTGACVSLHGWVVALEYGELRPTRRDPSLLTSRRALEGCAYSGSGTSDRPAGRRLGREPRYQRRTAAHFGHRLGVW